MSLLCAISGVPPDDPVASKRTGVVYERRLIEKHLNETSKCPVTGDDLSPEDLLSLRSSQTARPRPATAQSIPGLLAAFQNEWDAVMLEQCELRKQLHMTRQELSHVLYQHDAACRVIARISRERDAARAALADARVASGGAVASPANEAGKLPKAIVEKMINLSQESTAQRKKDNKAGKRSATLASMEHIAGMKEELSVAPHSTSVPGITCCAVRDAQYLATGGADGAVVLFDRQSRQIAQKLTGHTKTVRDIAFHPTRPVLVSCSDDGSARVWQSDSGTEYKAAAAVRDHAKAVRSVVITKTGDHFVTASLDCTWGFYDIERHKQVFSGVDPSKQVKKGYTCGRFHPDGLLLALGTRDGAEQACCIWDLSHMAVAAKMDHGAAVNSVSFHNNGYHMASASDDGTVKLWDLRKIKAFKTLTFDAPPNHVAYDASGSYLAVATNTVQLYSAGKQTDATEIVAFNGHDTQHPVTHLAWGPDAQWLVSVGMDRQLKCYTAQAPEAPEADGDSGMA